LLLTILTRVNLFLSFKSLCEFLLTCSLKYMRVLQLSVTEFKLSFVFVGGVFKNFDTPKGCVRIYPNLVYSNYDNFLSVNPSIISYQYVISKFLISHLSLYDTPQYIIPRGTSYYHQSYRSSSQRYTISVSCYLDSFQSLFFPTFSIISVIHTYSRRINPT